MYIVILRYSPVQDESDAAINSDEEVLDEELNRRSEEEAVRQESPIVEGGDLTRKRSRSTRSTKGLKKRQYSPSIKGKKMVKRRKSCLLYTSDAADE